MTTQTAKPRRPSTRERNRAIAAEKKRQAKLAKLRADEERAELLAPKVQREAVLGRDGNVLRGARLEQEGSVFVRSNPIKRLMAKSRNKDTPTVTKEHVEAADRLLIDWEEGAIGIAMGCSNYGERAGGSTTTGYIAEAVLHSINHQIHARQEVARVQAELGALWPVIHAVVIRGIEPSIWGEMCGMSKAVSTGYFAASLDVLVRAYAPKKEPRSFIRSVRVSTQSDDPPIP